MRIFLQIVNVIIFNKTYLDSEVLIILEIINQFCSMKKLFYLLLVLPLTMFVSCDDKDEVSPFDMTITMSGVTESNGNFYTVKGNEVTVSGLDVKALNGTATEVSNVMFYIDGAPLLASPWNQNPWSFSTANFAAGVHTVSVSGYLLQVDHSLKNFAVSYPLVIVDSDENLPPDAPEIGSYSHTVTFD